MGEKKLYTTSEAAKLIGISKPTLLYWFKKRQVPEVGRDYNGWRVFAEEDIERLRAFKERPMERPKTVEAKPREERRRSRRVKAEFPIYLPGLVGGDSSRLSSEAIASDVSMGGLLLDTELDVVPFGQMVLKMAIPTVSKPVEAVGEVRWARRHDHSKRLGIQFVEVSEVSKKALNELIAQRVED